MSVQMRAKNVSHDQSDPRPIALGPKVLIRTGIDVPDRTGHDWRIELTGRALQTHRRHDSQADGAASIPVTRSTTTQSQRIIAADSDQVREP